MDIPILYKTNQFFFCEKPVGVASEGEKETDLPVLLEHQLHKPVYPVHRLDQGVGGVMVFALTKQAAAHLSRQVQQHTMEKEYWAVVTGVPEEPQGTFHDFLYRDAVKRKAFVVKKVRRGVKEAVLHYQVEKTVLQQKRRFSLIKIQLVTGRFHQIRVQFAYRHMPLVGDGKYGSRIKAPAPALWCAGLTVKDPQTGETVRIEKQPSQKDFPWKLFFDLSCTAKGEGL